MIEINYSAISDLLPRLPPPLPLTGVADGVCRGGGGSHSVAARPALGDWHALALDSVKKLAERTAAAAHPVAGGRWSCVGKRAELKP